MFVIRKDDIVIEIRTGFEPFAMAMLLACLLWSGLTLSALGNVSGTTVRAMPSWAIYLFFTGMFAGAAVTIIGVVMEKFFTKLYGFYAEIAGLVALFSLCVTFAYWVGFVVGSAGANFIIFMAAISIASAWRSLLIVLGLRQAKKVVSP
jgi:hypothetical protein